MEQRFCRLCALFSGEQPDMVKEADRLYGLMPANEQAGAELIKERLALCNKCEKLSGDTCLSCGCYPLIRAMARGSRCPLKKW